MPHVGAVVLNADDRPANRYVRTRLLARAGFHVIEAATGQEALRVATQHRPAVVLLDVNLPDISGFEVAREIRSNPLLASSQIVHISAEAVSPEEQQKGLCHADSYLTEPVPPDLLLAHVRALARTHAAMVMAANRGHEAERRLAELAESEQRFRTMADGLPLMIWVHDAEGRQEFVNRTFCEFFGVSAAEMRGSRWQALMHADDAAGYAEKFFACVRDKRSFHARVRVMRADGEWRLIESWARPRTSPAGDFLGFVGTSLDITDAEAAEEAVRRSEEKYRSLFESMGEGFVVGRMLYDDAGHARDYQLIEANAAWERLTGISREHALNGTIRQLIPTLEPRWIDVHAEVVESGEPVHWEAFDQQTGKSWAIFSYRPAPGSFASVFTDITEPTRVREELARQRELLQAIVDNIPVMLCIYDPQIRTFRFNRAMVRTLGWTEADADGDFMAKVYPDPAYRQMVSEYMKSLEPGWRDLQSTAKDGTQVDCSWANVRLADDRFIGIGIDIRDRKRAEEALRRSNEELQQFAYAVSHDLQEPLRGIITGAELLNRRLQGRFEPENVELLRTVIESGQRMSVLLRDLLTYSRLEQSETQAQPTVDLNTVLQFALANLREAIRTTEASITWGTLPAVPGDATALAQVLQNLIGNALKYRDGKAPEVHVSAEASGRDWLISVRDNGVGIDPRHHNRIFGLFTRLHGTSIPGTGIGLALCRKIVERHNGRIWVESSPGQGAIFRFTLPAAPAHPAVNS